MNKAFIFSIGMLMLTACTKKSSNNSTPTSTTSTVTTTKTVDSVTIVDNGTTYIYYSNTENSPISGTGLGCSIEKTPYNSIFSLKVNATTSNLITMSLANVSGPVNSLGIYKCTPIDSTKNIGIYNNSFTETFSGGESYTVDSIMVNVTNAAGSAVTGTYQVWLTNAGGSKSVTGSIYFQ